MRFILAREFWVDDARDAAADALGVDVDGRIAWLGARTDIPAGADVDEQFADAVVLPGFVEAHTHPDSAWLWQAGAYLGAMDRRRPDGTLCRGCDTLDAVRMRLSEHAATLPPGAPLLAWGYDPFLSTGAELDRRILDEISVVRPVFVLHASQHVAVVNSVIIAADRLDDAPAIGIERDGAGELTGILREPAAMLSTAIARAALTGGFSPEVLHGFAAEARAAGCTTVSDLDALPLSTEDGIRAYADTVSAEGFGVRMAAFTHVHLDDDASLQASVAASVRARELSTPSFRGGFAKLFLDGSLQARTAAVSEPYLGGGTGMWLTEPARFAQAFRALDAAGIAVHVHSNGDAAARVFADVVTALAAERPRDPQRPPHVLTHAQLVDPADLARISAAGAEVSFLINHVRWWGDAHITQTLGPARAARLDAAATAAAHGVSFSLHSDNPVTPIGPLELISNAVTRRTTAGKILGPSERISVTDAIAAVTRVPAAQLGLGRDVGRLRVGYRADLVGLATSPLEAEPDGIRDIPIIGTMRDGRRLP